MPGRHWRAIKDRAIREVNRLRQSQRVLKPEVDAFETAIREVGLLLTEINADNLEVPDSLRLQEQLADEVKKDIGEYIIQEKLIEDIKEELKGLLQNIIKIARHLKAVTEGNQRAIEAVEVANLNINNFHKFAGHYSAELQAMEGYVDAHDRKEIKKAIIEIDEVVEKFNKLQSAQGAEHKIALDIEKVMRDHGGKIRGEWEATVHAKGTLSHFGPLKQSLKDLLGIIFAVHHEDFKKERDYRQFMSRLIHLKPTG